MQVPFSLVEKLHVPWLTLVFFLSLPSYPLLDHCHLSLLVEPSVWLHSEQGLAKSVFGIRLLRYHPRSIW